MVNRAHAFLKKSVCNIVDFILQHFGRHVMASVVVSRAKIIERTFRTLRASFTRGIHFFLLNFKSMVLCLGRVQFKTVSMLLSEFRPLI